MDSTNASRENQNVINLSTKILTNHQISILSRGLKFIPSYATKINPISEMDLFIKTIKTQYHFRNIHTPKPAFYIKRKSEWVPPDPEEQDIIQLIAALSNQASMTSNIPQPHDHSNTTPQDNSNITPEEEEALKGLLRMHDIIIKPADKSGCFVIMDKGDYINKVNSLLSDTNTYQEVDKDYTHKVAEDIQSYLIYIQQKYNISQHIINKFKPPSKPRTSQFYIIPKTHKVGNPPRPIVSACEYSTSHISQFITQLINPLAKKNPTYLGSTQEFINIIKNQGDFPKHRSKDLFLVTADITSMYTNIPHQEAIDSIASIIEENRSTMPKITPHQNVIRMFLHFILKQNFFQFMDKFYLQKEGVAMGCNVAPALANIFMHDLEKTMLKPFEKQIHIYRRYIDDIFFIWRSTAKKLETFMEHCNTTHPSIKFTFVSSKQKIDFLDVTVYLDKKRYLQTTVYQKPSKRNTYLHRTSLHAPHIFSNIIYNQTKRFISINSSDTNLKKQVSQLKKCFLKRGYRRGDTTNQINRALNHKPHHSIKPKPRVSSIACRMSHSIQSKYQQQNIKRIWNQYTNNTRLRNIWPSTPSFTAPYHANLAKLLIRAKTKV